jgi:hypothetical protein
MLNYNDTKTVSRQINTFDNIRIDSFKKVKTSDIIKFNLGVAYFTALVFLLLKLIFT